MTSDKMRPVPVPLDAPPAAEAVELAGHAVLDDVYELLNRFVAFPRESSRVAVALWIAHTHAFRHAAATPYLNVYSPAPRCGKSTLFEVLSLLVRDPIGGSNMSPAALYRIIDQQHPTLLLDEMDAQMRADRERASAIQSILNSGYKSGPTAVVWRCEAPSFKPVSFEVFCPKAFAGIGNANLHPTTLDRTVPILLERKRPDDAVARFRARQVQPEAEALRERVSEWLEAVSEELDAAEPALPEELDDRTQEIWEPLIAIADAAGGRWPLAARTAALDLHTEPDLEDLPLGILLLSDIQKVFDRLDVWTVGSDELSHYLNQITESPWGNWTTHGVKSGLGPRALARFLRPFGIRPKTIRLGGEEKPTRKGYRRDWFDEAWTRYVPPVSSDAADDE